MAKIITGIKYFFKFYFVLLILAIIGEMLKNYHLILNYLPEIVIFIALIILYTLRKKLNISLKWPFSPKRPAYSKKRKWKLIYLGIITYLSIILFRVININNNYVYSYIKTTFIIVLCIGVVGFLGWFIYNKIQNDKLAKSGINKIDLMSGVEFEEYLNVLFARKGYRVETTPGSGDFGADLLISKDGQKAVVQAKRYNDKVGIHAVQEVIGALAHYKCTEGLVVTNNYFTPAAVELAKSNSIQLWDRNELLKEILSK